MMKKAHLNLTRIFTLGAMLTCSSTASFAQSGHSIESVVTTPGTTVPRSPTDSVDTSARPSKKPSDGALQLSKSTLKMDSKKTKAKPNEKPTKKSEENNEIEKD